MQITIPGLLLQVVPYLGQKKILKVFTGAHGMLSLFANSCTLTPFCLAEWVFRKGEKEIHNLQEASLIDPLSHLRENYDALLSAGAIAQDLLKTQMPNKKAQELFDLAYLYFKKLSTKPAHLAASFKLKLLLHEGLFSTEPDPTFAPEEWNQVEMLAFSKSLSAIQSAPSFPHSKIKALFEQRICH